MSKLQIDDISIDASKIQLNTRRIDEATVQEYVTAIDNGTHMPPIIVFDDGGKLWLADGFHRLSAFRFLGRQVIEAEIKQGTLKDAAVFAATANVKHGRPMSQAQKREAGKRLLELTDWGDRKIARRLALDNSTVTRWHQSLSVEKSTDTIRTVTRGGTTYPMNTANIGLPRPKRSDHVMDVMSSSESPEWYTPPHIIELTLRLFGGTIDTDPCSNSKDNPNIPAMFLYTKEDNGLSQVWHGSVYMNPPYGKEIPNWTEALVEKYTGGEIEEAIALLPGRIDTRWFQPMYDYLICNIRGRLNYPQSESATPFPSVIVYLGNNQSGFVQIFSELGPILRRIDR